MPLEVSSALKLKHPCYQPIFRMKDQCVQGALGTGALGGGILRQRKLKERVKLDALAAEPGIVEDHAPAADVAGASQRWKTQPRSTSLAQHAEISVAEIVPAERDAAVRIPQAIEHHQRIGCPRGLQHFELKSIVEPRIHQFQRQSDTTGRRAANLSRHLAQPAEDASLLLGKLVAGQRGGEVLLQRQWARSPGSR